MKIKSLFFVAVFAALAAFASFTPTAGSPFAHDRAAVADVIQTGHVAKAPTFAADFQLIPAAFADETPAPAPSLSPAPGVSFPVPEADIAALLLQLATNYKTLGVLGILVIVTLLSVQLIKRFVPEDFKWKRVIVLAVSIVYSILAGVIIPGSNALSVIVSVFITSGGAIALFEALKGAGLFQKKTA